MVVIVRLLAVTLPPVPVDDEPGAAERRWRRGVALEICNLPELVTSIAAAFSPEVENEPPVIVVVPPVAVTTPLRLEACGGHCTLFSASVPPDVPPVPPGPL